jgi:hypothetical protein
MNRSPFLNALAAEGYIAVVSSVLYYIPRMFADTGDSVMIPIFFLSLFVLSAAMMGYFFVYQPVRLLIENKPKEAARFFLSTVAIFACITGAMVLVWYATSLF